MVLRLEEIRLPHPVNGIEGAFDLAGAVGAYARTFREYGIDVERLQPAEAGRRIQARTIRRELTVAIDQWAETYIRQNIRRAPDAMWKHLIAVARAADTDALRNTIRDALERSDREMLSKLARSPEASQLPVQTASLLGSFSFSDPEDGSSLLRRVQRENPDDFWINFQVAWTLDFSLPPIQDLDAAIRFYTAALAVRPRNAPTHYYLAEVLRRRGLRDESIAEHRKAIELDPEGSIPRVAIIVHHLLAHRQFAEAIAWCRRFVEWKPQDSQTHALLGDALYHSGEVDEAFSETEKAIALKPDGANEQNSLAWILATCPEVRRRDPRRAVEMARNAVTLAANRGEYWNTLGVALYYAGDWKGAITALNQSVAIQGTNSWDGYFLAMARWKSGEREEARRLFDEAVRWMEKKEPNDDDLLRFRAEAAQLLGIGEPVRSEGKIAPR
jgi:tetratricopeptide (TPR) repeat protein